VNQTKFVILLGDCKVSKIQELLIKLDFWVFSKYWKKNNASIDVAGFEQASH